MYKHAQIQLCGTHSTLIPISYHTLYLVKHKMWSALLIILTVIVASLAMLLYGALAYEVYQYCYRYWTSSHSETHQLPGPNSIGSPVQLVHLALSSIINTDNIELSELSPTPRQVQSPCQPSYSYSSSIINLEMMEISVDHLAELSPAQCSSATLKHYCMICCASS